MPTIDDWLTPKEAADLLNSTDRWIMRLCKAQRLTAQKKGGRWLVLRQSVLDYRDQRERSA